ncbi:MAG: hypothetical protein LBM98_08590 [Oscillospiraceae bacterium]|nr:hypothetical protein [Oscillospiraceae bacterium]
MLQVRSNPVPGGKHTCLRSVRVVRQPWIASPRTDLRNSTMRAFRRPRRTGFAMTVRRGGAPR